MHSSISTSQLNISPARLRFDESIRTAEPSSRTTSFKDSLHAALRVQSEPAVAPLTADSLDTKPSQAPAPEKGDLLEVIQQLAGSWNEQGTGFDTLLTNSSTQLAPFLEAQRISQNWSLRTQIISSGMQNIQQALRELRQAGGA